MEEKKVKQDNLFKRWYKLCEPNKVVWFFQTLYYVLYAVLYALLTIFAAKTINCLYMQEWKSAYFWLCVELLSIILRDVFIHLQYIYYSKHYGIIRKNITNKVYDKLINLDDKSLKSFSAEKIINIAQNNMEYAGEFPDYLAGILQYVIQVAIAMVTIFVINIYAGLIVAGIGVLNYFVYNFLNKRMGRLLNNRYERKDDSFKEYSRIIAGKAVIEEVGAAKDDYKTKLMQHIDGFNKEYLNYYKTYSYRDNIYHAIWNVLVYAITAFLIYLVSKGSLEVGVYIIIVPYLTSCTEKLNSLYTKFGNIENVRVDVDRLYSILNLTDKQIIQYGNINKMSEGYNLGFMDVCYRSPTEQNINLKNLNISFKMNGVNIIKGERNCGKRAVFDMLRRKIKPDSGTILLDNLNLYDYNEKTFKNHINYCSAHPYFLVGTVKDNLLVVNKDFKVITALVNELGLTENIEALPKGYDTPIEDIKSGETLFWIGLIRAALSKCKVLMIYEYPEDVTPNFHTTLQKIIATSEPYKRTLIFFTHKDDYDNLADQLLKIEKGRIKEIKSIKKK